MKVFIQIPCYNEEQTLPETFKDIPREIPGIEEVRILIADDGSTDRTVEVAKELGADYILTHRSNVGLARNYQDSLAACMHLGADIIVNTDGDNQYRGEDIPKLIQPILEGKADYVVGCRDIKNHKEFSSLKKQLQLLGSWVLRVTSNTNIPDATSGFRALHRDAALKVNVLNRFSYTLETLIQAGNSDTRVDWVPIRVNAKTRESRLFKSMPEFISRQLATMLRMFAFYAPFKFFSMIAASCFSVALLSGMWIAWHVLFPPFESWHVKVGALIMATLFLLLGALLMVMGVIGSNLAGLRQMLNEMQVRQRHESLLNKTPPPFNIIDNT